MKDINLYKLIEKNRIKVYSEREISGTKHTWMHGRDNSSKGKILMVKYHGKGTNITKHVELVTPFVNRIKQEGRSMDLIDKRRPISVFNVKFVGWDLKFNLEDGENMYVAKFSKKRIWDGN